MLLKYGTLLAMTNQNTTAISGVVTKKISPRRTSINSAAAMEPTAKNGQRINMRMVMAIASCTWLTSLVMRVMRDGVPKRSRSAKDSRLICA